MDRKEIPDWMDVSEKKDRGENLTPFELFIYNNEPAGDSQWRKELSEAMETYKREGVIEELEKELRIAQEEIMSIGHPDAIKWAGARAERIKLRISELKK